MLIAPAIFGSLIFFISASTVYSKDVNFAGYVIELVVVQIFDDSELKFATNRLKLLNESYVLNVRNSVRLETSLTPVTCTMLLTSLITIS